MNNRQEQDVSFKGLPLFSEGSDQRRKVLAPRSLEAASDWAVGEMCGKMDGGFSRMRLLMVLFVPVIPG